MKTIRIFRTRGLILAAALGVSVGFTSLAFAQNVSQSVIVNPDGKVTYLGTLGGSTSDINNAGINDAGQVVGDHYNPDVGSPHAFITGPNGVGMTDLGTLGGTNSDSSYSSYATGINDAGQVVGRSSFDGGPLVHAFITGPNGVGMTDLGTLGGTDVFDSSGAYGINDAGQVAGTSETADGSFHAFITGPDGIGLTDPGTLGGYSEARGINDSGQVVGFSQTAGGSTHVFITGPDGIGMTDLGTLGGAYGEAFGINDSGQVVGYSDTADGFFHAFITGPNGVGMTDLGTLGGDDGSVAYGINDAGQVVGFSQTAGGSSHAFITGPNGMGMTDLNSIVDLPGGGYLRSAEGINNLGQIIATVVIPEPASYALMLAGLGLVGFMARRKRVPGNTVARG